MNIKSWHDLPCITEMYHPDDPANTDNFAIWSEKMDEAYESDPTEFDAETGLIIKTMLSGEPVEDMMKLYDEYENAVLCYRESVLDSKMDYESYMEEC